MGMFIQYVIFLYMFMFGANSIQAYSSRTNYRKLEIVESRLNTVIKELEFVKEDLKEEKQKSSYLEIRLDTLMVGGKGTSVDNKDPNKEVETVQTDPEQRVYNALYDEKQERKVFENHVKKILKDEKVNMKMKIATLNKTLTTHIDTKLNTLQDEVLHSVTGLNDYIASIKELTSTVKQNENSITHVKLESEKQNTALLRHDAMLVSFSDSLVYVEASLVEVKNSCHDKGWSGWSSWSTCSKSCGVGLQTSVRTCSSAETPSSGKCCIGSDTKKQICTLPSCPEWSGWSSWTSCSSSCGVGQQKSTRTCDSTLSGRRCIGTDTKTRVCTLRSCPEWSGWSSWTSCSSSCGVGHQKSTRTCSPVDTPLSRSRCIGSDTKTRVCTIRSCPDLHPKDCLEVLNQNKNKANGVYNVRSPSSGLVYPVYCDMTTDGGGWTVFQKRFDGRLDFYRTFKEYEDGFGDVNAEFWMGLKRIHDMTAHHETELRIHLTAADGSTAFHTFQDFSVSPGPDYKLRVGQSTGTAGDEYGGLTHNNGMRFSTKDKDVDVYGEDCAELWHGGWWYESCSYVNLNGDYATPGTQSSYHSGHGGVVYRSFKQFQSLKTTTIMFRRK